MKPIKLAYAENVQRIQKADQIEKLEFKYNLTKTLMRQANTSGNFIEWNELAIELGKLAKELGALRKEAA